MALLFSTVCPAPSKAQDTPDALEEDAQVQTTAERIASIREMTLYARYAEAQLAAQELLDRTDLSATQRNQALEMKAIILLARRQARRARAVLGELYGRDPEHQLLDRDVGPEVRAAFERARDSNPVRATVTLENGTLEELSERQSPPVAVRLTEGANVVQELRLNYRNGDSGPFEGVVMRLDETRTLGRTRAPLAAGRDGYVMQFYVEALAPSRSVVGMLGSPAEPLTLSVPAEAERETVTIVRTEHATDSAPGTSVLEEWWFWTIVGVVVAGGGAALLSLYFTHVIGPPGPGSLGETTWSLGEVRF